jgi:type II secretory pathway pseudopilin PulG
VRATVCQADARASSTSSGFGLLELLVSMAITLLVTGAIVQLLNPSRAAAQVQPEAQDMQQRMRVATDALFKELAVAGAGPYLGATTGSLGQFVPAILPRVLGANAPDAAGAAFDDRITIIHVPDTASQTTTSAALADAGAPLVVVQAPGCPIAAPACGFSADEEALVFDRLGSFDLFTVSGVAGNAAQLELRAEVMSTSYPAGVVAARVESRSYYLDASAKELKVYDDGSGAAVPLVDNVVGLAFEYFGDPLPPTRPKPPAGTANCLYDAKGTYLGGVMTTMAGDGSLAPLPLSMFTDGPWCGGGTNLFDADLLRIRRVRVTIRIQTPLAALRGRDPLLFSNHGTSREGQRFLPDLVSTFSVTPRNLNLDR